MIPLVVNCASTWAKQTSGSVGQKGGSFTLTAARVVAAVAVGAGASTGAAGAGASASLMINVSVTNVMDVQQEPRGVTSYQNVLRMSKQMVT